MSRSCSVVGCDRSVQAKGLCHGHYERKRRTGSPGPADLSRPRRSICSVSDCQRIVMAEGLCQMHVRRLRKSGDPLVVPAPLAGPENPRWKGDDVGYLMAHQRVTKLRGSARSYACVDCGGQARHWAYTHQDPHQKRTPKGYPYSLDPSFYVPRCPSCHRRFDLRVKRVAS